MCWEPASQEARKGVGHPTEESAADFPTQRDFHLQIKSEYFSDWKDKGESVG